MTIHRPIHITVSNDLLNACRKTIALNKGINTYADLFNARLDGKIAPITAKPETASVKLFLTEEQHQQIQEDATEAGMSVSAYVTAVYEGKLDCDERS